MDDASAWVVSFEDGYRLRVPVLALAGLLVPGVVIVAALLLLAVLLRDA